jgi:DNA-binding NtrC family response regulator
MQGFLVSRPLPADEMTHFMTSFQPPRIPADSDAMSTLLLVDDEASMLSSLQRLLRRENYRILVASSGEEALTLLAENEVGVIISDQRMPAMSGTELLTRVRKMHPKTVRIILSGYTGLESLTEAINNGEIYKYLMKPWDDAELIETIRGAFRHYSEAIGYNGKTPEQK